MNGERKRVLRYPKTGSAAAVLLAACVVLAGCATGRPAVDSWGDAGVAAEQRLVIEQQEQLIAKQRRQFEEMGAVVAEVHDGLGRAVDALKESLDGDADLNAQFGEIDAFVRGVIEGQRKLEEYQRRLEELQRADSGADAGP